MKAEHKKILKTVGIIVGVIATVVIVQYVRFWNQVKTLASGSTIVLPNHYFPFNGSFQADANGKVTKA